MACFFFFSGCVPEGGRDPYIALNHFFLLFKFGGSLLQKISHDFFLNESGKIWATSSRCQQKPMMDPYNSYNLPIDLVNILW